ncbi:glutamine synthetase nodule isozyme-like [Solanum dulcamara]|uniref:glutamine synthetase nodule isozyme-like n=1 Tax=Solanum dulcamara TaxID=45834 RepID=UPI0024855CA1|nr:glutamine synthetase nodule isozyme-like [Solanum dulcamara]
MTLAFANAAIVLCKREGQEALPSRTRPEAYRKPWEVNEGSFQTKIDITEVTANVRIFIRLEFQVGLAVGISPYDDLWVAHHIFVKIAEATDVIVSFDLKPVEGECNVTAAHTNYSTKSMRSDGGLEVIKKAIEKLAKRHKEHIASYGVGNEPCLTGEHEITDINTLNFGIADCGTSIRIRRDTEKAGKGYLEDRRPSSNMDPYVVTTMIAETTILWK